jgi:VCBS repeat-containing protein
VLDPATGTFVYTPNANYNGGDSFVVTISDGNGGTTTSLVTIGINPVNDAPVSNDQSLVTDEDTPINGQVVASDVDGDSLSFSVSGQPTNGAVSLNPATGGFVYTPNANYNGSDSFVVTIIDGKGGTTTSRINIGINPVNDAPVSSDQNLTTPEDVALTGRVVATDIEGDTLAYAVSGQPANGSVSLNPATGGFVYTPNANYNGSDSFVVTISDGNGGTTTSRINIGVTPVNDAPVANNVNLTTPEDTPISSQISASDIDGDTLTFAVTGSPANGSVSLNPATGTFTYTPSANYNGSDSFTVTISDGNGGTTTSLVTIGVTPVNDGPSAANLNLTTDEDVPVNGAISANDPDGDTLSYSVSGNPANGSVVLNPATGTFTYTPNAGYGGSDSFVVSVSDGKGGVATSTVTIGVNPLNDAPVASDLSLKTAEDTAVNGAISATDPDSDPLSYSVSGNPANGTVVLNPSTGTFVYTPNANYNGNDSFVVTISDGNGGTTTSNVTINVSPDNDAPVTADQSLTTNQNQSLSGTITGSDPDGDSLRFLLQTPPASGSLSLDILTGQFIYNPGTGFKGTDSFVVRVSDGKGGTALSTITIGVLPVNTTPDAVDDPASTQLSAGVPASVNLTWSQPFISSITASGGTLITSNADGVAGAMGVVGRGTTTEVDDEIQNGESILVTFNAPTLSARFGFAKLDFTGVPETGLWIAYLNGVEVGRGQFNPTDTTRTGTVDIRDISGNAVAFDQLKFDTAAAGSDYVVSWLTVGRNTATVQEGMSISIPAGTGVLANDTDSDGGTLVVSAVRTGAEAGVGTAGTLGVALQGAYGKLTLNADGSYGYTADNLAALHPGQIAKDYFTYTLSDGQGGTDKATLTISVFGAMGSDNQFYGTSGNNTLTGTSGADIISGAAGNDDLTGGLGADTFQWALADKGSSLAPATDVVQDFSSSQGDVLHLSELLQGENNSNLTNYLHFTYDAGLNQTTVHVSSGGGYSSGYNAGATDQIIVLNSLSVSGTNQEIINQLKASGNLITD